MSIPSMPKLGAPPAPVLLRKIALEEHFGHPIVSMRDSDRRKIAYENAKALYML